MNMIFAIAAGGAMGAVLRHFVGAASLHLFDSDFPWGTLIVNVGGSFMMGLLIAAFAHFGNPSQEIRAFLTVGFLGALTTFSTFSLDTSILWERGDILGTGGYVLASVTCSIAALFAGLYFVRQFIS